jgi:hypothetical protein
VLSVTLLRLADHKIDHQIWHVSMWVKVNIDGHRMREIPLESTTQPVHKGKLPSGTLPQEDWELGAPSIGDLGAQ